ncbi:MAG: hypothetical protein R3221_11650 [Spongiibacter sp.]|nr:hypothetical protein [Spongiibacter sp.]
MNQRLLVFFVASILILLGLWVALNPRHSTPGTIAPDNTPAVSADSGYAASYSATKVAIFELDIVGGKLVSGPSQMIVNKGDDIVIRVRSNFGDELHLHGYDIKQALVAGQQHQLQFEARYAGHFELELHSNHSPVSILAVMPD